MASIKSIKIRQALSHTINLGTTIASTLIMAKIVMCVIGTEAPAAVVLSGSMEPAFKRGDVLFFHMTKDPIRVGEIVLFNVQGKNIPIVHRVIEVHDREGTYDADILTKGDNNGVNDRVGNLYADGQRWLKPQHIIGKAFGYLPYVGWVGVILTENPLIMCILLALMVIPFPSLKSSFQNMAKRLRYLLHI